MKEAKKSKGILALSFRKSLIWSAFAFLFFFLYGVVYLIFIEGGIDVSFITVLYGVYVALRATIVLVGVPIFLISMAYYYFFKKK